ncbi:ABC transporter substrate-binding protein [Dactylosporangium sp. CA-233914]|uniref:ABC transporter substrate-binding protein n=1 Tax=Dactylosporangium sp. CA-233914 TaxID=3239934 RepID=UPI003D8BE4C6
MKKSLRLVVACALLLGLAGCAAEGSAGGRSNSRLVIGLSSLPPTLDTSLTTLVPASVLARNVFESLVTTDSQWNVRPMLADSWDVSADGLQIVFHLRQGVLFHDGSELTAEDVVASMRRWTTLSSQGRTAFPGAQWRSDSPTTVTLTMRKPNVVALQILGYNDGNLAAVMPAKIAEKAGRKPLKTFVGTGPYKLASFDKDQSIVFTRFDRYVARAEEPDGLAGDRTGTYETIEVQRSPDLQSLLAGAETAAYDIANVTPDDWSRVAGSRDLYGVSDPQGSLYLNYNKRRGPFTDLNARLAVNAAIDNQAIMRASFTAPELYDLRPGIMLRNQPQWTATTDERSYNLHNLELARRYLASSSYDGRPIVIVGVQGDPSNRGATVLQQELEAAGFATKLQILDSTTYLATRDNPAAWDILVAAQTPKPEPSAMIFFNKDYAGWTNSPELDAAISDYRASASFDEATRKYSAILTAFEEYRPLTKVGDYNSPYAVSRDIKVRMMDGPILWSIK